jgi:anti-sigma regulatory factor (Ser/Thr protein kinase)
LATDSTMPAQSTGRARRHTDFAFVLAPGAHAPAEARRELETRLPGGLPPSLVDDVLLLTTELVTNSVRHSPAAADGTVDVAVFLAPDRIRVEVTDPGSGFAHSPQRPGTLSEGGRGLFLVDVLADRWGMGHGDGTMVWYELGVERDDEPAKPAAPAATGANLRASAALRQTPGGPAGTEQQVATEAVELAAELRGLAASNESLAVQARDIEADLARVAGNLKAGAEALRQREKVARPHFDGP